MLSPLKTLLIRKAFQFLWHLLCMELYQLLGEKQKADTTSVGSAQKKNVKRSVGV